MTAPFIGANKWLSSIPDTSRPVEFVPVAIPRDKGKILKILEISKSYSVISSPNRAPGG